MSRKREVVGQDERGRPIARWEPGDPPAPQFGHMEPAIDTTVQRQRLTPDELAARIAADPVAEAKPDHRPDPGAAAHMQQSRMKGAKRHVEIVAASRAAPAKEEVPVSEEPTNRSTNIPESIPEAEPVELPEHVGGDDPYLTLIAAANEARQATTAARVARVVLEDAEHRAELAREVLAAAWQVVSLTEELEALTLAASPAAIRHERLLEGLPDDAILPEPFAEEARASAVLDEHPEGAHTVKPSRSRPGGPDSRAREADQRGREVLAALERHGGDTRKAGLELGMRGNVVGRIASAARARGLQVEASA